MPPKLARYNGVGMTNRSFLHDEDPKVSKLRQEIREQLPYGNDWLNTPHALLGGESPEQKLASGGYDAVRNLFLNILYVGMT